MLFNLDHGLSLRPKRDKTGDVYIGDKGGRVNRGNTSRLKEKRLTPGYIEEKKRL